LVLDVDDVVNDVAATGIGAVDAFFEFFVGGAELVMFASEGVVILSVLFANVFEFGVEVCYFRVSCFEFGSKFVLDTLVFGFEGVNTAEKLG